uniref:Circularly permutated Ras protein 1-like n=1 Tax=Astyanax mexicanus TaxID=7994 RepID=A0A8B9LKX3_ASTMX
KPVRCGKCRAVMSAVNNSQTYPNTWCCEFCGKENILSQSEAKMGRSPLWSSLGRDVLYVDEEIDADYMNLEDMLVVFCVDISGSMSVTSEVNVCEFLQILYLCLVVYFQGVQEALQMALSSLQKSSPHRRVALVTFNDEVTVYGDGTGVPLSVRDWALVDYDHVKEQGEKYSTPHCIAETYQFLTQRVKELREHGATALGPAALISVAMASQFTGSKVIICTDGRANIGLGQLEPESAHSPPPSLYFYNQLATHAAEKGVIVSVMTFEGEDCRLAEVGKLADHTGGRVSVLAQSKKFLLDFILIEYNQENHKLVREIGNVTDGVEITFQFAVRPDKVDSFQRRDRVPFQLQLSFKTRDLKKVTRVISQQKRVTTSSWVWAGSLNMSVLGVHCAQLCARLTMEGRIQEAQSQLKAQQDLLKDIRCVLVYQGCLLGSGSDLLDPSDLCYRQSK